MLPNVSKLRLNDEKCAPCMTPVRFRNRDQQLEDHMNSFVFHETIEDQIKAADCSICTEPLAFNNSRADPRRAAAEATPFYVDYCGNNHYIHKWCAYKLLAQAETTPCPDCRSQLTDNARIEIAESYPTPGAGAPAAAPAAPTAPAPAATTRLPPLRRGEERLGAQRATDRLVQWHFWLKPADSVAVTRLGSPEVQDRMRDTFTSYIGDHYSDIMGAAMVSRLPQRFEVETHMIHATLSTRNVDPNAPMLLVICKLWLPRTPAVSFTEFFRYDARQFSRGSMMRRWLGIIGAEMGDGERMTAGLYGNWSDLHDQPNLRPDIPDTFTTNQADYYNMRSYSLEDDPMPIFEGRRGPQSTTDVAVEWRLWVKGRFLHWFSMAIHVRNYLSRWFHNEFESQSSIDMRTRFVVTTDIEGGPNAVPDSDSPVSRIDCELYLPTMELAEAFVEACARAARNGDPAAGPDLELLMRRIVGVTSGAGAGRMPTIRRGPLTFSKRVGAIPYDPPQMPPMTQAAYDAWARYTVLDPPPAVEAPSDPEPSSSAAFQEQARQERLEEARYLSMGGQSAPEGEDEDVEMEEGGGREGEGRETRDSPLPGPYVPTSPSYSPTSPV